MKRRLARLLDVWATVSEVIVLGAVLGLLGGAVLAAEYGATVRVETVAP